MLFVVLLQTLFPRKINHGTSSAKKHSSRNKNWMHVRFDLFTAGEKMVKGEMRCLCSCFSSMSVQMKNLLTILDIAAAHNAISFSYPACGLPPPPLTVSWAVQCVLTLAHLHVSPMSNANHTGPQCCANPAISKLLSHSFISPHRLHCGTKQSTRMCCNCNCNSSVSHLRCQCSVLHNSEQFLYEHKHEAAIINQSPAITQAIY